MRQRHIGVAPKAGRGYRCRARSRALQPAAPPEGYNPFVLVNYSPTICLNPRPYLRQGDG
jgi:hypothetical protein